MNTGDGSICQGREILFRIPMLLSFANMKWQSSSWKQKVHPLFVESARVYRDAVTALLTLRPHPSPKQVVQIKTRFREEIEKVRTRHAQAQYAPKEADPLDTILVDEPSSWPPSQRETDQAFLEHLYWKRFNEPLWIALQKEATGDLVALRRIQRVEEDYERIRFGKGPIKAAKGDPDHAMLFEIGLDLGLSVLTSEELADCFDAVCPCGKIHDADALKKQRSRKQKSIQEARNWLAAERAKMSTREWILVYGKYRLYAKGIPLIGDVPRRVYVGNIGEHPFCDIDEQGNVVVEDGSKFANRSVPRELPHAFGVESSRELFTMFFPDDLDQPDKQAGSNLKQPYRVEKKYDPI
jgi:hypothetical protein